jgi:hypothetical protein
LILVDPRRAAGFVDGHHGEGVAAERHAVAKLVADTENGGPGIGSLHIGLLAPDPGRPREDIDGTTTPRYRVMTCPLALDEKP